MNSKKQNRSKNNKPQGRNKSSQKPKKDGKNIEQFQWKRAGKTSLIWVMIISVAIYLSGMFTDNAKKEPILQFSQYREFLQNRQISEGTFVDNTFHGSLKTPQSITTEYGTKDNVTHFQVILPFIDQNVMDEWEEYGIDYSFKEEIDLISEDIKFIKTSYKPIILKDNFTNSSIFYMKTMCLLIEINTLAVFSDEF